MCERDCLLFLAECIADGNPEGNDDDAMAALDISIPSMHGSYLGFEDKSDKTRPGSPATRSGNMPLGLNVAPLENITPGGPKSPAHILSNRSYKFFDIMPKIIRDMKIARKTIILSKIEY